MSSHNTSSSSTNIPLYKTAEKEEETLYKLEDKPSPSMSVSHATQFEEKVRKYVADKSPKLVILTPCYGASCYVGFVDCLFHTIRICEQMGIPTAYEFCKNDSLVSRARNNLIAKAMAHPAHFTHFLFIDNDITWDPNDVLKLLVADKLLVGGAYPLKNYEWDKLLKDKHNPYNTNTIQSMLDKKRGGQLNTLVGDLDYVKYNLLNYNINFLSPEMRIENNLVEVKHLATGFMMISRKVIEKMSQAFPSTKYVDDVHFLQGEENVFAFALFDTGVIDNHYYSEDWMFCHRWAKMGGKICLDITVKLSHFGNNQFDGYFLTTIL